MHDLLIRGALVYDGSGGEPFRADVAITDGKIAEVGLSCGIAHRTLDVDGAALIPGFVDIHTHYDGQAVWDSHLAPSSWHGVTTVVAGNCGVGFAPVHNNHRERLIQLMEGVEDIPGTALHEGLTWEWRSFPDYLDCLDARPRDIDMGCQLPHGALRLFAMGERGAEETPAMNDDIDLMASLAAEAVHAGALGFSTSRTILHRTSLGENTPTLRAGRDELVGIAKGAASGGDAVLQVVSDFDDLDFEFETFRQMAAQSGLPLSISIVQQNDRPEQWRDILDLCSKAERDNLRIKGQVGVRGVGVLIGHGTTINPFKRSPLYQSLMQSPQAEFVSALNDATNRSVILEEVRQIAAEKGRTPLAGIDPRNTYVLGSHPNYEPVQSDSLAAIAIDRQKDELSTGYDLLLQNEGQEFLYSPVLNYAHGNLDAVHEQLLHPAAIPGLSDGGAHVGTICDVSFPTTLLEYWARDRNGPKIPLPLAIKKQCRDTAVALGLRDRGLLAPGYKADLNVVDLANVSVLPPELHHDLPAGGKRILQRARGYLHTFVSGTEVASNGASTGELPGRLIRGQKTVTR